MKNQFTSVSMAIIFPNNFLNKTTDVNNVAKGESSNIAGGNVVWYMLWTIVWQLLKV